MSPILTPMIGVGNRLSGPRGQYQLLAEAGRGGFGVTFRAARVGDDLPVIVKVLRLPDLPGWKALELLEREATVLQALEHPGIPAFIDLVLADPAAPGTVALVMEHVPGPTLAKLSRSGGLSAPQMLRWFAQLLEILVYLHHRAPPVIHRDITPKNIILREDGRAVLVDFGSVQAALSAAATVTSTSAGTFGYAPQEQFIGRATPASDLYGLGMTFVAVATGREPGDMDSAGLRVEVRRMLDADPRLARLLESMIEPDPRFRLQSAREALREVAPLVSAAESPPRLSRVIELAPTPLQDWELSADAYLERLRDRLTADGFIIEAGGDAGRTPLAFSARKPLGGLGGGVLKLCATRAEAVDGTPPGRPLEAIACGLFVTAAVATHAGVPSFLGTLLGRRTIVVPVVVASAGLAPHTVARVAASLREPEAVAVIPALVDLAATSIDLVAAPAAQPGRMEELALIRRLLTPTG